MAEDKKHVTVLRPFRVNREKGGDTAERGDQLTVGAKGADITAGEAAYCVAHKKAVWGKVKITAPKKPAKSPPAKK
jgi:hypothetical protein